ncbi:GDP-mannose 4,6-dehydratase [Acidobacteria bacterium AH-259-G07]|nr:GDP-mannose 4,6-dehydratase [Acidobacteria bacterium AH-259-G07]
MSTYLVTGAAGFIGARVCEFLLAEGHKVVGLDNLNDAYDVRLKHWRLEQIQNNPNFEFHKADICNRGGLRSLFPSNFDAVINLAARAGVRQSVENPWIYFETNVTGSLNLLELCKEFGVKKFVLASTSSVYGSSNSQPFREDVNTNQPLSPYAASKKAAEALCHTYHYLHGIDVTVLRYFTVYGPAGRPDMSLFRFVQWITEGHEVSVFGDGRQSRDFTFVDDIARGTAQALKPLGYEIINLGSNTPVVLMDAIKLIQDLVGKKAKLRLRARHPADVTATWADIGKAEEIIYWKPSQVFAQGVKALVEWYQANRSWARNVVTD